MTAAVPSNRVEISVRDYGQWRERVASMDRGRGSTLMSAVGEIVATPSPEGTTSLEGEYQTLLISSQSMLVR